MRPGTSLDDVSRAGARGVARAGSPLRWGGDRGYPVGAGFPPDWGDSSCQVPAGDQTVLQPGMAFHQPIALRLLGKIGVAFGDGPDHRDRLRGADADRASTRGPLTAPWPPFRARPISSSSGAASGASLAYHFARKQAGRSSWWSGSSSPPAQPGARPRWSGASTAWTFSLALPPAAAIFQRWRDVIGGGDPGFQQVGYLVLVGADEAVRSHPQRSLGRRRSGRRSADLPGRREGSCPPSPSRTS